MEADADLDLFELLRGMNNVAANLAKLEELLERAQSATSSGEGGEYEAIARAWSSMLSGLPLIGGRTVTEQLPAVEMRRGNRTGEGETVARTFDLSRELEAPRLQLDEYRFRLGQARRHAIKDRLAELVAIVDEALLDIMKNVDPTSSVKIYNDKTVEIADAVSEIDELLGDAVERGAGWIDLRRHLRFSEGHDWHDISSRDWPLVRTGIEEGGLADSVPLPVPNMDLGAAALATPFAGNRLRFSWEALKAEDFEELIFRLFERFPTYMNVQLLTKTNATDRGRDISTDRIISDESGLDRIERTFIQAKHWQSQSLSPRDITESFSSLKTWQPPVIRALIIVTSGRFSANAVDVAEKHNTEGNMPFITLWANTHLESVLSRNLDLASHYSGLITS